ncbi:MAG: hypothetical protein JNL74_05370 [Fibrobacteres bacterium]|nr:hypothetical protein [Fibrobacterota bacterium]
MESIKISAVEPNWAGFMRNIKREGTPSRVHYFEHGISPEILEKFTELYGLRKNNDLDTASNVHRFLGHEIFRVFPPGARMSAPRVRETWAQEGSGPIASFEDLEKFDWPKPQNADLSVLDHYEKNLPENMRVFHVVDIWEVVRDLVGFEPVCMMFYDNPELIEALFEKVGSFVEKVVESCCDYACYGAVYLGDDLGYKSSLMLSPTMIRKLIFPWHKRIADLSHKKGKLFFLHSCGQMYSLMDEYIDYVKIDAKHSFEDAVLPVTGAKVKYGSRATLLGGIDVDLLSRSSEPELRAKTREILSGCVPGGGYCFGSGNWVTSYVPFENYQIVLDEARKFKCI